MRRDSVVTCQMTPARLAAEQRQETREDAPTTTDLAVF